MSIAAVTASNRNGTNDLVIDARGIVNQFGSHRVHDGLDFQLERGKIRALVGGSGTGKTVLLHTLIMLRQANALIAVIELQSTASARCGPMPLVQL